MFQGKVVIVTGASQGIGKAIASAYSQKGATVIAADITEVTEPAIHFIQTDVRKEADIRSLMTQVAEQHGKIDILINNAGKFIVKPPTELELEIWEDIINTNLRSVFLCSRRLRNICKGELSYRLLPHVLFNLNHIQRPMQRVREGLLH